MCLGGPDYDAIAAEQRRREAARQAAIASGRTQIDEALSGFDDDFYAGRKQAYLDYATPQVDDQYEDARKQLTLALSRSGQLQSGTAVNRFTDLKKDYKARLLDIANNARQVATDARRNVEQTRSDLYTNLAASADPASAANAALARAETLEARPQFSPIGNVFQNATAGLAAAKTGQDRRYVENLLDGVNISPLSGGKNVRVVS